MRKTISICITLFLAFAATALRAQTDTTFFDAKWNKTTRDSASYFRPPPKLENGLYRVEDHYLDGRLQMSGSYSNIDSEMKEGYFRFFDSSEHISSEGMYRKGKSQGAWKAYYAGSEAIKAVDNFVDDVVEGMSTTYDSASHNPVRFGLVKKGMKIGEWSYFYQGTTRLSCTIEYKNDLENGLYVKHDSTTGNIKTRGYFKDGKQTGLWQYYKAKNGKLWAEDTRQEDMLNGYCRYFDSTGQVIDEMTYVLDTLQGERKTWYPATHKLKSSAHYKDGNFDGELKTYYADGKVKRIEHYKDNRRIDSVCYTHNGSEEAYYPFWLKPSFPGDLDIYTETYIRYPYPALAVKKGGRVFIEFWVDEEGSFSEIKIDKGIGGTCDEAALNFVSNMPQWNPGKLDGEPTRMKGYLVVNFILRTSKVETVQF